MPANARDGTVLEPMLNAVPPVRQCRGCPRRRPAAKLHADKACDRRRACRVVRRIARRGVGRAGRLGRHRWVMERPLAWFALARRLAMRHEPAG
jgi:hypothetical protein